MKKESFKTDVQIEAERKEAQDLIALIIAKTNTIPPKVNAGSYQTAVNYKNDAISARSAATSKAPILEKLRSAWMSIQFYYS